MLRSGDDITVDIIYLRLYVLARIDVCCNVDGC